MVQKLIKIVNTKTIKLTLHKLGCICIYIKILVILPSKFEINVVGKQEQGKENLENDVDGFDAVSLSLIVLQIKFWPTFFWEFWWEKHTCMLNIQKNT